MFAGGPTDDRSYIWPDRDGPPSFRPAGMSHGFSGAGEGPQTPDGCSVELYRRLPYMGELEAIEPMLIEHPAVLELGCGTGRLCARMVALGLRVTGVDESTEMLAHLPAEVEAVCSKIEALALGRRWPAVLLASHLVNHPEPAVREAFAAAAWRHLTLGGCFFVKRHDTRWLQTVQAGFLCAAHGVAYHAEQIERRGAEVSMRLRYELDGSRWWHSFTTTAMSEADVESLLRAQGFGTCRWLGDKRLWGVAGGVA